MKLDSAVDWESFRPRLEGVWCKCGREGRVATGRKPWDAVLMFKVMVLCILHNMSDEQAERSIGNRLDFIRFLGMDSDVEKRAPDAGTIRMYRDQLAKAGAVEGLFADFGRFLDSKGYAAKEGQIMYASLVGLPKQRNSREENAQIKQGKAPEEWKGKPSRLAQKGADASWTRKNGESRFGCKFDRLVSRVWMLCRLLVAVPAFMALMGSASAAATSAAVVPPPAAAEDGMLLAVGTAAGMLGNPPTEFPAYHAPEPVTLAQANTAPVFIDIANRIILLWDLDGEIVLYEPAEDAEDDAITYNIKDKPDWIFYGVPHTDFGGDVNVTMSIDISAVPAGTETYTLTVTAEDEHGAQATEKAFTLFFLEKMEGVDPFVSMADGIIEFSYENDICSLKDDVSGLKFSNLGTDFYDFQIDFLDIKNVVMTDVCGTRVSYISEDDNSVLYDVDYGASMPGIIQIEYASPTDGFDVSFWVADFEYFVEGANSSGEKNTDKYVIFAPGLNHYHHMVMHATVTVSELLGRVSPGPLATLSVSSASRTDFGSISNWMVVPTAEKDVRVTPSANGYEAVVELTGTEQIGLGQVDSVLARITIFARGEIMSGVLFDSQHALESRLVVKTPPALSIPSVYQPQCSSCHGASGEGVGTAPALDTLSSDIANDQEKAARIVLGREGGDHASLGIATSLSDVDIAAALAHIYTSWNNDGDVVTDVQVKLWRDKDQFATSSLAASRNEDRDSETASSSGAAVATIQLAGTTTLTSPAFSFVAGADESSFAIDSSTGVISLSSEHRFNYESKDSYTLNIRATGSGSSGAADARFTLTIVNLDEKPAWAPDLSNQRGNNTSDSFDFTVPEASDPEGETPLIYAATERGESSLPTGVTFDNDPAVREFTVATNAAGGIYVIEVTATDPNSTGSGLSNEAAMVGSADFTLVILRDQFDSSSLSPNRDEDRDTAPASSSGAVIATVQLIGTTTLVSPAFSILAGADGRGFAIDSSTGVISLSSEHRFDHESKDSYTISIQVTSSDGSMEDAQFILTIDNLDEKPAWDPDLPNQSGNNSEDPFDFTIPAASDPEGETPLTYAATESGESSLPTGVTFDNDPAVREFTVATNLAPGIYVIEVTATDPASAGSGLSNEAAMVGSADFTLVILRDQFDSGSLSPHRDEDPDTAPASSSGEVIATVQLIGATTLVSPSFSILTGADGSRFAIDSSTGVISLKFQNRFDHESKDSYTINIRATGSGGGMEDAQFILTIDDLDEKPAWTRRARPREQIGNNTSAPFDFTIQAAYDPDGETPLTYAATERGESSLPAGVQFDPDTREFTVTTGTAGGTYVIEVTATDPDSTGSGRRNEAARVGRARFNLEVRRDQIDSSSAAVSRNEGFGRRPGNSKRRGHCDHTTARIHHSCQPGLHHPGWRRRALL